MHRRLPAAVSRSLLGGQRCYISTRPSALMLHLDAQGAKRSYISAIREKEKEEKERASECEAAMLVHQSFIKARASCERAASLVRAGRDEQAEKHALAALRYCRSLGDDYRTLCTRALSLLVTSYTAQNRWVDAEPLARELVERQRLTLGDKHPSTMEPMQQLASIMAANGRFREAGDLLKVVIASCADVYGNRHQATLAAQELLQLASEGLARQLSGQRQRSDDLHEMVWLHRFFSHKSPAVL